MVHTWFLVPWLPQFQLVLATPFKIRGVNYSISSACATSAHCIGHAIELIQLGKQDVVFAGGGEELHWSSAMMFDAMGALSTKYNETPDHASRTYDADRDGFVISGGGGMVVIEELRACYLLVARKFTVKSSVTVRLLMAMTWLLHQVKVLYVV